MKFITLDNCRHLDFYLHYYYGPGRVVPVLIKPKHQPLPPRIPCLVAAVPACLINAVPIPIAHHVSFVDDDFVVLRRDAVVGDGDVAAAVQVRRYQPSCSVLTLLND